MILFLTTLWFAYQKNEVFPFKNYWCVGKKFKKKKVSFTVKEKELKFENRNLCKIYFKLNFNKKNLFKEISNRIGLGFHQMWLWIMERFYYHKFFFE